MGSIKIQRFYIVVSIVSLAFCLSFLIMYKKAQAELALATAEVSRLKAATGSGIDHQIHRPTIKAGANLGANGDKISIKSNPSPSLADLWKNPTWQTARLNEAILGVESKYGRFFSTLVGWSPQQIEDFKLRLAENKLSLDRAASSFASLSTDEEATAQTQAVIRAISINAESLRTALGSDDYLKLEDYEHAESHRDSVAVITNAMRAKGVQISGDLDDAILMAYTAALRDAAVVASKTNSPGLNKTQVQELHSQQKRAFQNLLIRHLGGVLDEKQLYIFMEAQVEQQEGGLVD